MGLKYCRLKKKQQLKLLEFYVLEVTARAAADLIGLQLNTSTLFYHKIRIIIAEKLEIDVFEEFGGEIEMDELCFDAAHKDKKDQDIAERVPMFGILIRNDKVYTQLIDAAKAEVLTPTIRQIITPDSIVYTDSYLPNSTIHISESRYFKINRSELLTSKHNHLKRIDNFWGQTKPILRKYNGIVPKNFNLFLKECEFRFNYGSHKQQLTTLKKWCDL